MIELSLNKETSLMKLLAIPLTRQKTAASGWLSREGGNPARKNSAKRAKPKS